MSVSRTPRDESPILMSPFERRTSKAVFFFVLFPGRTLDWRAKRLVRVLIAPEENGDTSSSSFSLGRSSLPWAPSTLRESTAVWPEGAIRALGPACATGAGASTSRGDGTSDTARGRKVSARSASGRRRGGRPNTTRLPRPKPGTPRPSAHAASGSSTRNFSISPGSSAIA
jgi:hypothetical protein